MQLPLGDREVRLTCYWYRYGAAYTPLVIGPRQTVPLDGGLVCTSYSDPHNHVASMMAP